MSAEKSMDVIRSLDDTEERDVDFFIFQWRHCVSETQERDLIKSFRRQMLIVATHMAFPENDEPPMSGVAKAALIAP